MSADKRKDDVMHVGKSRFILFTTLLSILLFGLLLASVTFELSFIQDNLKGPHIQIAVVLILSNVMLLVNFPRWYKSYLKDRHFQEWFPMGVTSFLIGAAVGAIPILLKIESEQQAIYVIGRYNEQQENLQRYYPIILERTIESIDPQSGDTQVSPLIFPVYFFDPAGCADDKCDSFNTGMQITKADERNLKGVLAGLADCQTAEKSVSIEIYGFASSSSFKTKKGELRADSDDLNLKAANLRGKEVESLIEKIIDEQQLELTKDVIRVVPWLSYKKMKESNNFLEDNSYQDDVGPKFSKERGLLNRRVEIRLTDPGDCSVLNKKTDVYAIRQTL